ncbi:PREDICTED: acyl-CoA Delta(11) desaturase-like, partial [Dinoponera quadriceps]|uniref:Acyl-CoA Delta(11) desaturase-like n=1 Tax=Dinoponera quadriceps TaxID=609295 RepID=A0A6P3Y6F8_DINQU
MMLNICTIPENSEVLINNDLTKELQNQPTSTHKWKKNWNNIIVICIYHLFGLYGLYLMCFQAKYWTTLWVFVFGYISIIGVSAGAHRLWSHRSYKAKWPMKLILMILQTACYQLSIHWWARKHRMHHKYSDTDADPHNPKRGFFFAHIGWFLVEKHPEHIKKLSKVDITDLEQDPIVAFQKRWYMYLALIFAFILPSLIPYWCWGETLWCSWNANIFRCLFNMHLIFLINSSAHRWGTKTYT